MLNEKELLSFLRMKNFVIVAVVVIFSTLVLAEEAKKVGDCPTDAIQFLALTKMKEVVCSKTKAEELASKYNLKLPDDWEWTMVDAWITGIRGFLKTSKFVTCEDMEKTPDLSE